MDFINQVFVSMDWSLILTLFAVALVAGFVDAIAGGGGLLTLPALLLFGLSPVNAIATNKFQAASATVSASVAFARKKLINWQEVWPMLIFAALGSASGALFANYVSQNILRALIPFLLIGVALYFALSPSLSDKSAKARITAFAFAITVVPLLGFYDGIFGPGIGSFLMVGFVSLLGLPMVKAMGHTKVVNAASNLGALAVFAVSGNIIWSLAITMAIGAFIGAQLGAKLAIHVGKRLIKPMLITMCLLMALRLLFAEGGWLHAMLS